ncbi:MAG: helicase-related protein [bacterium]
MLAEGVNLQDAALLINFDVHWNPVRMIQRAGRIDRRLNPAIEEATRFPDLEALATTLDASPPRYWWHARPGAAPVTVNLLLPDDLEAELQLRERIANKTLAIDFTLGLEQGTGAEAEWMTDYRYQGISALNAWQGDRAIEQVAGYQERIRRLLTERGIDPAWSAAYDGWLRERGADDLAPLVAWTRFVLSTGDEIHATRLLRPIAHQGITHWLVTSTRPSERLAFWLALDGVTFPPLTRADLPYTPGGSEPVSPDHLLALALRLVEERPELDELDDDAIGWPLLQGATAIAASRLQDPSDRAQTDDTLRGFRILQLALRPDAPAPVEPAP